MLVTISPHIRLRSRNGVETKYKGESFNDRPFFRKTKSGGTCETIASVNNKIIATIVSMLQFKSNGIWRLDLVEKYYKANHPVYTMCENDDILVVISDDDIPKLRDKYKQFFPRTAYVYNFLNCVIEWKKENRDKNYFTLMSPHGNWSSGTFVALQEWSGSDLFIATLDESYDLPYTVLTRTRKIQWNKLFVLYAVQKFNFPMVLKALQEVQFPIHHFNTYDVWWISKKLALELEIENCPTDVHIAELEPAHATVINSHWSSVFPGSDVYLTTFIKLNGGFGAFLKSDGTLVSWILKNQIGLGALQTLEAYKGNGYATLIVKHMARKIAEGNEDPLGTILQSNSQSQSLFKKLGFVIVETVVFVESEIIQ